MFDTTLRCVPVAAGYFGPFHLCSFPAFVGCLKKTGQPKNLLASQNDGAFPHFHQSPLKAATPVFLPSSDVQRWSAAINKREEKMGGRGEEFRGGKPKTVAEIRPSEKAGRGDVWGHLETWKSQFCCDPVVSCGQHGEWWASQWGMDWRGTLAFMSPPGTDPATSTGITISPSPFRWLRRIPTPTSGFPVHYRLQQRFQ